MDNKNICNCSSCGCGANNNKKILNIVWQRLISDGITCPRCGSTEKELEKAWIALKKSLEPLGINVELKKKRINPGRF